MSDLTRELDALQARNVTLVVDVPAVDINRITGLPKADARVRHPAVLLTFDHPKLGELRYPCGTYGDWQDNVRAIALTLQLLRRIDSYGVTTGSGEQFAGFKALPAQTGGRTLTLDDALAEVARWNVGAQGVETAVALMRLDAGYRAAAIRKALAAAHPDAGGSDAAFAAVGAARAVIETALAPVPAPITPEVSNG